MTLTEVPSIDTSKKGKASKAELLTEITKLREEINGLFLFVLCSSKLNNYCMFTDECSQVVF